MIGNAVAAGLGLVGAVMATSQSQVEAGVGLVALLVACWLAWRVRILDQRTKRLEETIEGNNDEQTDN